MGRSGVSPVLSDAKKKKIIIIFSSPHSTLNFKGVGTLVCVLSKHTFSFLLKKGTVIVNFKNNHWWCNG